MKQADGYTYTLSLSVRNRPGVLVRCAQVFGRRGHNIESLNVVPEPVHQDIAHITITAFGEAHVMQQIVAQLSKLIDVLDVKESET